MTEGLIVALFGVGIFGLLWFRNVIKKIIGLGIANSAVVLLFVIAGGATGNHAPIWVIGRAAGSEGFVDPMPQALMLTAIVIGVSLTALCLVLAFVLYQRYGTLDLTDIEAQAKRDTP